MTAGHLFALACAAASAAARADDSSFTIGASGCAVVDPNPHPGGRFEDGVIEGEVEVEGSKGWHDTGGWRNMKANGQGDFTCNDGSPYVGDVVDGPREGQATMTGFGRTRTGSWHGNALEGPVLWESAAHVEYAEGGVHDGAVSHDRRTGAAR